MKRNHSLLEYTRDNDTQVSKLGPSGPSCLALAAISFNGAEPLQPSWIFNRHNFSLFRSRSHPVAKEQVSAQSDLRFEKRCRKLIFMMAAVVAILDFLSAHLAILCLIRVLMLIIKFWFNWIIEEMSKIWSLNIFPILMYRAHTKAWGSKFDLL